MIKSIEGYSYKINEHIGKGYSSTVHKGKNDSTGQDVSIKVIQMSKLQDPINHMLLQFQVAALKSLAGTSNNLHLYDVYATKNNTYIITELMEGDLHSLLKQKKQFPYYEACQILKQIVTGYVDVYKSGYLHRDIKPANIFYRNGSYKIGDFGFAIPAKDSHQHRAYNVGSPVYMPPEALKQNKYSPSCDTWAIGIIFYQLLKGMVPWRAISEQKLYEKITTEPLFELTIGLPEIARTFLSKLLNLEQHQRMTPQQLINWPSKLFAVEIRSMTPVQTRHLVSKSPLQQISLNKNFIQNQVPSYSRSKSYSSNQVPNQVSGLRINLTNIQGNIAQNSNKLIQNVLLVPSSNNNLNHTSNQNNYQTVKQTNFSQKNSAIFIQEQNKEIRLLKQISTPQQYANTMIQYLKFIYRVIKFIGHPSQVPLKDLQQSLTRTLFKQIQKINNYTNSQNSESLKVQGWSDFIKSPQGESKMIKKLKKLTQKCKMFHTLPKNEFILDVYRQQLIDGIKKVTSFIQNQKNPSDKTLVSLQFLITFYEIWQQKENPQKKVDFKEFLSKWKFSYLVQDNAYQIPTGLFNELKNKIRSLGLNNNEQYPIGNRDIRINLPKQIELIRQI